MPAQYHGIFGIIFTRISFENVNPLQPADYPRPISIDFLNFSPKIKRISGAQKKQLMDSGRQVGRSVVVGATAGGRTVMVS